MNTVLIVDDAKHVRTSLKTILERNGYNVIGEADNGRAAVEKYKELNPHIVAMDITMPEMNGILAFEEIKYHNPEPNVFMISAVGQDSEISQAILLGAKGFIIKPFNEEIIINVLNKAL